MSPLAKTKFFEARPFKPKDTDAIVSWMSISPLDLFMVSSSLSFPVKPQILIKNAQKANPAQHKFYSVFLIKTGKHAGYFEIKNINEKNKIGTGAHVILSPEYRGKGMGKDFIELISKVGFTILGLHRISISVHTINTVAIAAYIKAGYSFEGVIREALLFNGKRYSLYQMSLLRSEWEGVYFKVRRNK